MSDSNNPGIITFKARATGTAVEVYLPDMGALDKVLGTDLWKVKEDEGVILSSSDASTTGSDADADEEGEAVKSRCGDLKFAW